MSMYNVAAHIVRYVLVCVVVSRFEIFVESLSWPGAYDELIYPGFLTSNIRSQRYRDRNFVMEAHNFTKRQIKNYVHTFLEKHKELTDKRIQISLINTSGWEYLLKCLESLCNDEVCIESKSNLDKYKAFTFIFDKYQIFNQVVSLVDRLESGTLRNTRLFGVPIAIKDNIAIKNVPFTNGSNFLKNYSPEYDATVVESLLEAGLIVIGKTKLDEFGVGSLTEGVINPYGEEYTVGGSSGGSSAVVGGKIVTCALGSDTGGSTRLPSSYCGCYGYRPSYGLISRFGLSELSAPFDTIGIISDSVYQSALLSHALVYHDVKDMNSSYSCDTVKEKIKEFMLKYEELSPEFPRPLQDFKIAVFDLEELCRLDYLDEDNKKNMQNVQMIMGELGAKIIQVDIARLEAYASIYHLYVAKQLTTNLKRFGSPVHTKNYSTDSIDLASNFYPKTVRRLNLGNIAVEGDVDVESLLEKEKKSLIEWIEKNRLFDEIDLLVTPVSVNALPVRGKREGCLVTSELYTTIAPILGLCSITIPSDRKNPLFSFQMTAGHMQDDKLFNAASAFEDFVNKMTL